MMKGEQSSARERESECETCHAVGRRWGGSLLWLLLLLLLATTREGMAGRVSARHKMIKARSRPSEAKRLFPLHSVACAAHARTCECGTLR